MENPTKKDDMGVPLFQETPIYTSKIVKPWVSIFLISTMKHGDMWGFAMDLPANNGDKWGVTIKHGETQHLLRFTETLLAHGDLAMK